MRLNEDDRPRFLSLRLRWLPGPATHGPHSFLFRMRDGRQVYLQLKG